MARLCSCLCCRFMKVIGYWVLLSSNNLFIANKCSSRCEKHCRTVADVSDPMTASRVCLTGRQTSVDHHTNSNSCVWLAGRQTSADHHTNYNSCVWLAGRHTSADHHTNSNSCVSDWQADRFQLTTTRTLTTVCLTGRQTSADHHTNSNSCVSDWQTDFSWPTHKL